MTQKQYMTVQEAAVHLNKSEFTIRSAVRRGLLKYSATEYGRKLLAVAELDAYAAQAKPGRPRKDGDASTPPPSA